MTERDRRGELVVGDKLPTCGYQVGKHSLLEQCGAPAHYAFELARQHWEKEHPDVPTDNPLIGYACRLHGGEAWKMPAVMRVWTIA